MARGPASMRIPFEERRSLTYRASKWWTAPGERWASLRRSGRLAPTCYVETVEPLSGSTSPATASVAWALPFFTRPRTVPTHATCPAISYARHGYRWTQLPAIGARQPTTPLIRLDRIHFLPTKSTTEPLPCPSGSTPTVPGFCCSPESYPFTLEGGAVATFDLSPFVPPFHVE